MGALGPPSLRAAASQQRSFDIELAIMRSCRTADFCANSSEPIPSSTLRALAISHAPDRALGLKAAVVLPFGQPVGALVHPQSVGAIDLGRQASRDLTSEAMKPREAA